MASASSSRGDRPRAGAAEPGAWDARPHAGAAEPGKVTFEDDDSSVLRVGFYNVGIQQSELDKKNAQDAKKKCMALAQDIADAFQKHSLDLLCLCELGEHTIGLHGRKNLSCDTQAELLQWVVRMANRLLGGASEPAELVSGDHPTYAVIRRRGSGLEVKDVLFHRRLDNRRSNLPDRTMLSLPCMWMGKPITIALANCPSSKKRPWDRNVKEAVLPNLFRHAGLVPFDEWGGGAAEPAAWILGGDLNMGEASISNYMKNFQPPHGGARSVQMLESGSFIKRHGDIALAQHVKAFRRAALIGKDYGGVSDAHNMVVVVAKPLPAAPQPAARGGAPEPAVRRVVLKARKNEGDARKATPCPADEPSKPDGPNAPSAKVARTESADQAARTPGAAGPAGSSDPLGATASTAGAKQALPNQAGGASEPAGRSASRPVDELTAAANQAAEKLARMLDEHLMLPERREAQDGYLYTEEEFREWYGEDSARRWEAAGRPEEYKWDRGDLHSIVGRALWPRDTPKRAMVAADGEVQLAAATCPPKDLVEDLFKTLLRVRQAQFEVEAGVTSSPDTWDTGAGEPGVPIDLDREFDGTEFGVVYARWRRQWLERATLQPWQEEQRQHLSSSDFGRKARSWFEAFLNNYLGCRHVARVIIQYGVTQPAVLTHLIEAIQKEKAQEREDAEEAHGAEEPVWRLRKAAHVARDALRSARSLSKKVEEGKVPFDALTPEQKETMEQFARRSLHVEVDRANQAYGHGIARTNDFGFREGENMCLHVPIHVRAALRVLKKQD